MMALLAGLAYVAIGRAFSLPTGDVRVWRLAAWLVSLMVYAAHLWYEHIRLRNSALSVALHVASGVAIGALGLAAWAMLRSLSVSPGLLTTWLLALVLWPLITAVPAFAVAFVIATMARRFAGRMARL